MTGTSLTTAVALCSLVTALAGCGGDDGAPSGERAGVTRPPLGDPIDVEPDEQWTWVPIEGSVCADGTGAGIGVNFTAQSRELVIWFQGNGVCYDAGSCSLFQSLLTGMGTDPLDHMWWGDMATGQIGIFDRNDPDNPFRKSNFVVFPHCGVDGHTADKESSYPPQQPVQQRGYANVTHALRRIVPTFLDATRIVVAGFSAGGIGAGSNYHQIATFFEAYGQKVPFLINDSGPVLRPPYLAPVGRNSLRTGWGLDRTIETWCPDCAAEGYHPVYETLARLHPGLRISVISAYGDGIATALYGMLNGDAGFNGAKFEEGLRDLSSWVEGYQNSVAPSRQQNFFYPGPRHGALAIAPLSATPGLVDFLRGQLGESEDWVSVEP
jgi:hypothetical protein